jgi:hypothetical protein
METIMVHVEVDRQLMIRVSNELGTLAEVTNAVSDSGINMIALCAYSIEDTVAIMFVTEDNNAAKQILEERGYDIVEEEVLLLSVENKPGALQAVTDKLAESGIDLSLIYGSVDKSAEICKIILIAKDNLTAMMVIKSEFGR